jgi:hypothetical protein
MLQGVEQLADAVQVTMGPKVFDSSPSCASRQIALFIEGKLALDPSKRSLWDCCFSAYCWLPLFARIVLTSYKENR